MSCSLLYFPGSRASMVPGLEQGAQTLQSRREEPQHCSSQWLSTLLRESCKTQQNPFILDNYLSLKVIKFYQILKFWFAWAGSEVGGFPPPLKPDPGKYSILLKKMAPFISFTHYDPLSPLLSVYSDGSPKYAIQPETYLSWKQRASHLCPLLTFPRDDIYSFIFQRNYLLDPSDKSQGIGTSMQKWMRKKLIQPKQMRHANAICVSATL